MSRESMRQALDALEKGETKLRWAAISALKQALAEPEQGPVASVTRGKLSMIRGDIITFDGASIPLYAAPTPHKPQTTHWEGCEAVHPECRAKSELERKSDAIQRLWKERDELRTLNAELVEALRHIEPILARMYGAQAADLPPMQIVRAALAKVEASNGS